MNETIEIKVPDIGDFKDVEVIEVLVSPGDQVTEEASLIALESDKTTMEIPAPCAGTVKSVSVKVGDRVSQNAAILTLEVDSEAAARVRSGAAANVAGDQGPADLVTEVVILGAGPGGYTAAFRAADLGKKVVLIERYETLGGVCLNVGCIPSKALLHTAVIMEEVKTLGVMGVTYAAPEVDLDQMRAGKNQVVAKLTGGLAAMAKQRKVQVIQGSGRFESPNRIGVETKEGRVRIQFDQAIIACGSSSIKIPGFPHEDPRVMDSTDALALADVPERMLIVGGGIIGLEMASVYSALGSKIDVVEFKDQLMPGCDLDLVRCVEKIIKKRYDRIMLETKVASLSASAEGIKAVFEGKHPGESTYDKVLVAVGRLPNGKLINAEAAGVKVDQHGFIKVDQHMRTNVPNIFAIGDVVGGPMLAHKATHEAKVAAEVIAGLPALFDPLTIPSVAYTDPEVAWMGLTETKAKADGIPYEKGVFPWAASGRALGIHRDEGMTKLLFDPETKRILGAGIAGPNAGELIGEAVLALEMGADMEDIGLTIHPHPTLCETIGLAAEMAHGSITDLIAPKKR
ncbi:dihydrolipoyl dehydrogenase [Thiocystis violascens]|uniref:Dihydrolipoyl dehydrogenase n=1 Tax=Thiocystis violascens (strain ATCC 17096 / DSM 198 / 6111) TaxID=765911 RepID=I3YE56_THIV6|nr:dihydrolipoyl dehydrogenase [Thiocystis violascens]AFL75274.1 dihydrolipoamide dehydrogenase [Thiocystis violascens DSM 198]